jgi:hypothetical protein
MMHEYKICCKRFVEIHISNAKRVDLAYPGKDEGALKRFLFLFGHPLKKY